MLIYKITNAINNKSYIGQTTGSLSQRKRGHKSMALNGSSLVIHRAIRKYGWDNFTWEILGKCGSKEKLDEMEFYYIKQFKTHISHKQGYNLTFGGEHNNAKENWENPKIRSKMINGIKNAWNRPGFKEKMSRIHKESWTKERCQKQSILVKERCQDPLFKKAMSKRGKNNWKDPEYRKTITEKAKDNWKNKDYRNKVIEGLKRSAHIIGDKNSKDYIITDMKGKETTIHNLKKWCRDHDVVYSTFCHYKNQSKYHKGYMVKHM